MWRGKLFFYFWLSSSFSSPKDALWDIKIYISIIKALIIRDKRPEWGIPARKMNACSFVSKYGEMLALASKKWAKNDRFELVCVCVCSTTHPKRKTHFFARAMKTSEQTPDPRWSLKVVTLQIVKRRWWLVFRRLVSRHKDALTHTLWPSGKSHEYLFSSSYFTCHSQFITHLCARTHTHTHTHTEWTTKAANEQECPQISETARQLSQQEGPPIGRLLSAANGAPSIRQWHAWLFPPRVC